MKTAALFLGTVLAALISAEVCQAQCGVERWPVKTGTDPDATSVRRNIIPTSIANLRSIPAPRPLPQASRVAPVEETIFSVPATLTAFKEEDDSDYHLVLSDEAGRTMIAEIPAINCFSGSTFATEMMFARQVFDSHLLAGRSFQHIAIPVEVTGIGFFDFLHGQTGVAPNGIELHPVLSINFQPLVNPIPPLHVRRRAAWPGIGIPGATPPSVCSVPTFTLTSSRSTACSGEPVTLTWQSSDSASTVSIDGVGTFLPPNGTATVGTSSAVAYSGRATNSCGTSQEAVVVLDVQQGATGSIFASPSIIQVNGGATITVIVGNSSGWFISSSLGNGLSLRSGSNGTFTIGYSGTQSGSDVITLSIGGSCGQIIRSTTIGVNPTTTGGGHLRCCDGSLSPSCTNCASKQGCCSSHGGVCGC